MLVGNDASDGHEAGGGGSAEEEEEGGVSKETKQRNCGWKMKSTEHHCEPDFSRFAVGEAPGCTIHP